MAEMEFVKKVDDLVQLRHVLVSCTDKDGLVSNKRKDGSTIEGIPENGLLGFITEKNPDVQFISTGGTYKIVKEAGLNVVEVSEVTRYPEMKTGLVKSLHPVIHAGLLAHKHTGSDDEFMTEHKIDYIDALIVNFYPLDEMMEKPDSTFEILRQNIDVGGPSMSHNARKAFISTAPITDPSGYKTLVEELKTNNGAISLATRLALAKKASKMITAYMVSVDKLMQKTEIADLEKCYEIKR